MVGKSFQSLDPVCVGSIKGSENPDPAKVDDRLWIQALASDDGVSVIALASHEYAGSRHGRCRATPTRERPTPCWYSSIVQLESHDGARTFRFASRNRIVATPQTPYDKDRVDRLGFLTTSNVVSDGLWRYVLVYVQGYAKQKTGTCVFRASKSSTDAEWKAWDGRGFDANLGKVQMKGGAEPVCEPIRLGSINRGLVRDRVSGKWIAIGPYRQRRKEGERAGIYFSVSSDLLSWTKPHLLTELTIDFRTPACRPVYKYPSIIDHEAPGHDFDSVGERAYLYLTKVEFEKCRYSGRKLVRIPLQLQQTSAGIEK